MDDSSKHPNPSKQPVRPKDRYTAIQKVIFAVVWPPLGLFATTGIIGILLGVLMEEFPGLQDFILGNMVVQYALTALINGVALVVVVVPFFHYFFPKGTSKKVVLGIQRAPVFRDLGLMVAAFFGYLILSTILTSLAGYFLPFVDLNQKQDLGIEVPQTSFELAIIFLLLVVFVPLLEEMIFRGFMFKAIRTRLSFWPTAILVSLVFGAAHGQWNVAIDTFALSLFLCGLREYTGSLWATVFLHAAKNGLAFSVLFLFPDILTRLQ